ncbi:MAG: DUF4388 domain-containing protein [Leptolinea sp.]
MALQGNLRDFPFAQLLNLVNLARKTGLLEISHKGETAQVYFRDGRLACALSTTEDSSLGAVLYQNKRISPNLFRAIKSKGGAIWDKELGLQLINAGFVSRETIFSSLQQHNVAILRRLFAWQEGAFRFIPNEPLPEDKISLNMELENLIMEGSRHIQEMELLMDEVPNLDVSIKFSDRPDSNLRKVNLTVEEWKVVSFVNPKNSIRQIGQATSMDDLQIRKVVYGLLQAGLVEVVRGNQQRPLPVTQLLSNQSKEEQRSLVNRLIDRVRGL